MNKWYMQKAKPVGENERQKITRDFEILADYFIPSRRFDRVIINEKIKKGKKKRTSEQRVKIKKTKPKETSTQTLPEN